MTFARAFRETARAHPGRVAIRTGDGAPAYTFVQLLERVDAVAGGLQRLGVGRGDTVALMLSNRPEFHVADLAAVSLGATPFSIYWTSPPEQIAYVCRDAGAKLAIVEDQFRETFDAADTGIKQVVRCEELAELEVAGFDCGPAAAAVEAGDVATLIYTSGTTGDPKGVQLTHDNVMHFAAVAAEVIDIQPGLRVVSWLPAAHIAERASHHYLPMILGGEITCCADPASIVRVLPRARPHWFFGVPRVWEKLKTGIEAMLAVAPEDEAIETREAIADAIEKVRIEQSGGTVPPNLARRVERADLLFFEELRRRFGLDEVLLANVGAAPTPVEVIEFFHAIGIELSEFWGMSETGVATINRPGRVRIGTVGQPVAGMEVKAAPDGELLIRGPGVMAGYRGMPERTAEVMDAEGWMASGDVGSIDPDGYVRILDRKKELIINAAGKNMSPANIEARVRAASPLIAHVCAIGDGRPYNTALVVLADGAHADLHALAQAIAAANERLARVEQIKRFHVVPGAWEPGGDELTPTMKLKRKPIAAKYVAEIEAMYDEAPHRDGEGLRDEPSVGRA